MGLGRPCRSGLGRLGHGLGFGLSEPVRPRRWGWLLGRGFALRLLGGRRGRTPWISVHGPRLHTRRLGLGDRRLWSDRLRGDPPGRPPPGRPPPGRPPPGRPPPGRPSRVPAPRTRRAAPGAARRLRAGRSRVHGPRAAAPPDAQRRRRGDQPTDRPLAQAHRQTHRSTTQPTGRSAWAGARRRCSRPLEARVLASRPSPTLRRGAIRTTGHRKPTRRPRARASRPIAGSRGPRSASRRLDPGTAGPMDRSFADPAGYTAHRRMIAKGGQQVLQGRPSGGSTSVPLTRAHDSRWAVSRKLPT